MKRRLFPIHVAMLVVALGCVSVAAHHGASAYDRTRSVTFKAVVSEFRWANPHTFIIFDAPNESGQLERWSCESINPAMMARQGWSKNTLKNGDTVTIVGNPSRTGSHVMLLEKIVLADGRELRAVLLD